MNITESDLIPTVAHRRGGGPGMYLRVLVNHDHHVAGVTVGVQTAALDVAGIDVLVTALQDARAMLTESGA